MGKKLTIEYIREQFEKEGYKLLTEVYENSRQKLKYICPKGHKHNITWASWQSERRCSCCAGNNKLTIEFVRHEFTKENYKLLTIIYKNCYQKLEYVCPNGHKHSISWTNWQTGYRCSYCMGVGSPTIKFIRSEFEKESYTLLTKVYINNRQKLNYICPRGHKHNITWHNWQKGRRCPYRIIIDSKGEIEVRNFVKSLGVEILPNNRSQIFNPETGNSLELDIFMPDLSKAIEYNGEYWHQDSNKDIFKQQLCELKGIDLLIIWENEWKTKRDVCKNKIKEFIFF